MRLACGMVAFVLGSCADVPTDGIPMSTTSAKQEGEPAQADPPGGGSDAPHLELLDEGTGERAKLVPSTEVGATRTLGIATVIDRPVPEEGASDTVPLRVVVAAQLDPGKKQDDPPRWFFAVRTVEYLEARGTEPPRAVRLMLRRMARLRGTASLDGGSVQWLDDEPEPGAAPVSEAVRSTIAAGMHHLVPSVPDEPVGLEARWRVVRGGTPAVTEVSYALTRRDEHGVELRIVPGGDGQSSTVMQLSTHAPLGSASDRFTLEGEAIQGGLVYGKARPGAEVTLGRRTMPVSEDGRFLVGFGRDARTPVLLAVQHVDGTRSIHVFAVQDRSYEEEVIDGLPDKMVDPPKPVKKVQDEANRQILAARLSPSLMPLYLDGFIWPTRGKVTSTYGRKRVLNGKDSGIHWGVDIGAPIGRKIRAPADGVVVHVARRLPLSGNVVVLDHGLGLTSTFLHLDKVALKQGAEVHQGDVVGRVGKTGRATGPHLDWRMNLLDIRIDPQLLVEGDPG